MIPAIGRTMTPGAEMETVPQGTPALLRDSTPPEGAPTTPADVDVLADARAEAHSWSPQHRARLRRRLAGLHQLVPREPVRLPAAAPATSADIWGT